MSASLTLPEGIVLRVLEYTVSGGPQNVTRTQSVDLTDSSVLRFRVGNLPIGSGYSVSMAGTTVDGTLCAGGSVGFTVSNSGLVGVALQLVCQRTIYQGDDAGDIVINVDVQVNPPRRCPVVSGISMLPAQIALGIPVQLEGFTQGDPPSALLWSAPSGTFSSSTSAATSYVCGTPGIVTLTFTASATGCPDSALSASMECTGPSGLDAGEAGASEAGALDGGAADGATVDSAAPPDAGPPPIVGKLTAIAAGLNHSCGLVANGALKCWGSDETGQLGDGAGTSAAQATPVSVVGLSGPVISLSAGLGEGHTCALLQGGAVQCWGRNDRGQLGTGTFVQSTSPVTVGGLAARAVSVAIGQAHTCALLETGAVQCWGWDNEGQLGNGGGNSNSNVPQTVVGLGGRATSLAAGILHTCVTIEGGAVQCWGSDANGQLTGTVGANAATAMTLTGLAGPAVDVAAGALHSCAVLADARVQCWGTDGSGQIGNGPPTSPTGSPVPPDFVLGLSPSDPVVRIDSGDRHTCVVLASSGLKCWGFDQNGQIGNANVNGGGTPQDRALQPSAVDVFGLTSGVRSVGGGNLHTCAMLTSGNAKCWGQDDSGQLGNGTASSGSAGDRTMSVDVIGFP